MSNTCTLCCETTELWAVGACDHPVCLTCTTRMRVLCEKNECPVCRETLERVVVTDSIKPYSSLPTQRLRGDRKHCIFFEKVELQELYKSIQQNSCSKCHEKPVFRLFAQLRDHCRKIHGLHYCEICTENLKLFPFEFRLYSRQELVRHRREGDEGNTSYKGHPLCKFCDERFLDKDTLHAHLRKDHFWCHFCESDGKQDYYCNYLLLRSHFKTEHFLCEEGYCQHEKYTSVFRNKLDLQAHKATAHSSRVSKAEAKQMRQLEVGFTYRCEEELRGVGGANKSGRSQWHQVQRGRVSRARESDDVEVALAKSESVQQPPQKETKSSQVQKSLKTKVGDKPAVQVKHKEEKRREKVEGKLKTNKEPIKNPPEQTKKTLDTVSTTTPAEVVVVPSNLQIRKPPGFENSPLSSAVDSALKSEWPDLSALSGTSALKQPSPSVAMPSIAQPPTLPLMRNYNPLKASNFPPLSSAMDSNAHKPSISHQVPPNANNLHLANSSSAPLLGSRPPTGGRPPGFADIDWHKLQDKEHSAPLKPRAYPSSITIPNISTRPKEEYVIDQVHQALNYDREKFARFRNLSGWYRNSEITAEDYVMQCRQLFGEGMWMAVGPQLAQVMPIESKRKELNNLLHSSPTQSSSFIPAFPPLAANSASTWAAVSQTTLDPPLTTDTAVANTQQHYQQSRRWKDGRNTVPNWQSEAEYPTLQQPHVGHSTSQSSWKARVPV